jgi:hypothetical protein
VHKTCYFTIYPYILSLRPGSKEMLCTNWREGPLEKKIWPA